jgi:DNA processing protein
VAVVSGLARGVDSAAHHGALRSGGRTVAVLGCGVDVTYPPEHGSLANAVSEAPGSAIVSELAPGTQPLHWFFPLRNRIISGLSHAVVVVEAGEKSGSLITARLALEQGREVMAVPGNVLGGRNRGGHALIRDGARIVESADDIVEELACCLLTAEVPLGAPALSGTGTPPDPVLASLPEGEALDLDHLAAETGLPPTRLLAKLFALELAGRVQHVGGGRFVRT